MILDRYDIGGIHTPVEDDGEGPANFEQMIGLAATDGAKAMERVVGRLKPHEREELEAILWRLLDNRTKTTQVLRPSA